MMGIIVYGIKVGHPSSFLETPHPKINETRYPTRPQPDTTDETPTAEPSQPEVKANDS